MAVKAFPFAFDHRYRLAGLPFGVTPGTTGVTVGDELRVTFGPWRLRTPLTNITAVEVTGPYSSAKPPGPAHLPSPAGGVTFAPNGRQGVGWRFSEPVRAMEPTG